MSTITSPATATTAGPEHGVYPMPAPGHDSRFTFGLISDVGKALAAHGYPPIRTCTDHVRLQQALFDFLYTLTPAGPAAAGLSPLPTTPADPGTPGEPAGADTSPHPFL